MTSMPSRSVANPNSKSSRIVPVAATLASAANAAAVLGKRVGWITVRIGPRSAAGLPEAEPARRGTASQLVVQAEVPEDEAREHVGTPS